MKGEKKEEKKEERKEERKGEKKGEKKGKGRKSGNCPENEIHEPGSRLDSECHRIIHGRDRRTIEFKTGSARDNASLSLSQQQHPHPSVPAHHLIRQYRKECGQYRSCGEYQYYCPHPCHLQQDSPARRTETVKQVDAVRIATQPGKETVIPLHAQQQEQCGKHRHHIQVTGYRSHPSR